MKIPNGLQPLIDDGMVDSVVRRLKSGKERRCSSWLRRRLRCAKVYKEAEHRGFHKLASTRKAARRATAVMPAPWAGAAATDASCRK